MSTQTKIDVYDIVTNKIIEQLEAGTIPWQKPWKEAGIPMNAISKRPYRGINVWLLSLLDYEKNLFLTWDQIKMLGASVRQGEHGHIVVFWKTMKKGDDLEQQGEEKIKNIALLRYYKVFNIAQCRDLPQGLIEKNPSSPNSLTAILNEKKNETIPECEVIIHSMPDCPPIKHEEQKAYYAIDGDYINMPKRKTFKSLEGYYQTLFHELVHSTGHEKRLNRKSITEMAEINDDLYSLEELVAELGACYISSLIGILDRQIKNSAAYINGWLKRLKGDKKFIVYAASHAQRAVDYIFGKSETTEETPEKNEASKIFPERQ